MKALTLIQPWASCVAYYDKRDENRNWPCLESVMGTQMLPIPFRVSSEVTRKLDTITKEAVSIREKMEQVL